MTWTQPFYVWVRTLAVILFQIFNFSSDVKSFIAKLRLKYLMKVLIILADDETSVYYLFYLCIMC